MERKDIVQYMAEKDPYYYGSAIFNQRIKNFSEKDALMEIEIIKAIKSSGLNIEKLSEEAHEIHKKIQHEKYLDNKKKYLEQKKAMAAKGKELQKIVQPGDIIKVRGTNDGQGHRLVLEVKDYEVICQKLEYIWRSKKFKKAKYITTHGWDKVVNVLHNKDACNDNNLIIDL